MGWLTRAIDAGKDHRNPLEDVADGLFVDIGDTAGEALAVLGAARARRRRSPPAASSATPRPP